WKRGRPTRGSHSMMTIRFKIGAALVACAFVAVGATPAKKKPASPQIKRKRYRSSAAGPKTAATSTKPTKAKRVRVPKGPPVSPKVRAEAHDGVFETVAHGADLPVENAAALVPFFEQLYRHQQGEIPGPLRILQYGDSHTAADEFTGDLRGHFQEKF